MKCLVLGADGFLGSHLIDDLLAQGHEVRAFDRFRNGKSFNITHLKGEIEFWSGDFLNLDELEKSLEGIDYVFHMISFSTPISSMKDPLLDINTNIAGSVNLFNLCAKKGIKKIIFPSSGGSIYGNSDIDDPIPEEHSLNPICPYAISKLTIEKYLNYFYKLHGLDYLIFRISNPYGERQNINGAQGVIPIFLNLIKHNKPITIYGSGENIRDYIYVKDVTDLISKTISQNTLEKTYNLGSGQGHSVLDLVSIMKNVCNRSIETQHIASPKSDLSKIVLDINKIKKEFSFQPTLSLTEGITTTWQYILNL